MSHMNTKDQLLTWILDRSDDHLETVRISAPVVGDILEGDEVRSRVKRAHRLLRISAGQIRLRGRDLKENVGDTNQCEFNLFAKMLISNFQLL